MAETLQLRPFQKRFITRTFRPEITTSALSLPRGNGKSWLAGHIITRILDPADSLFRAGTESVLCAASIEQARICFNFARPILEPTGEYSFTDNITRIGIRHKSTRTRLRVLSSNAKTAMGLVNTPYAIADEPGSWEVRGGELMFDALQTALGKPGSPLKIIFIGTLAPAESGWWHDLVAAGSDDTTYVQSLQGDPKKWDYWPEIRKCNPLSNISASFRKQLLKERDKARKDSRLKARFLSYRLNVPTRDEVEVLLTVDEWKRVLSRPVPERQGMPIVGVDMGGSRAWCSASALYQNGRAESLALCSGARSLAEMEKADRVERGEYSNLDNLYKCKPGQNVPLASDLVAAIRAHWGDVRHVIADRFRKQELQDAFGSNVYVEERVTQWSSASEDIRALRRIALDGPLSVDKQSRKLLSVSLAASKVEADKAGNVRMVKRTSSNESRDDVIISLVNAAGGYVRELARLSR